MKKIFLIYLLLIAGLVNGQTTVRGIVIAQNSGNKPIEGVQIITLGTVPEVSDGSGLFKLVFKTKVPGDRIFVSAISKKGYEIVNKKEIFDDWVIKSNPDFRTNIVMCPEGLLAENTLKYYNISLNGLTSGYKKRINTLQEQLDKAQIDAKTFSEQTRKLDEQFKDNQARLEELADKFARENFDNCLVIEQQSFEAFKLGNIEEAIRILETVDSQAEIEKAKRQKTKGGALENEGKQMQIQSAKVIVQNISKLMYQANLYMTDLRYNDAEKAYETAVIADTDSYKNVVEFAWFLKRINKYEKSLVWFDVALRHSLNDNQRIDCYRWLAYNNFYGLHNYMVTLEYSNIGLNLCIKKNDVFNAGAFFSYIIQIDRELDLLKNSDQQFDKDNSLNGLISIDSTIFLYSKLITDIPQSNDPATKIKNQQFIASIDYEIAKLFIDENKFLEADSLLNKSLNLFLLLLENDPSINNQLSLVYSHIGMSDFNLGNYEAAEKAYINSLECSKILYSKDSISNCIDYSTGLSCLAIYYGKLRKYDQADKYFSESISIQKKLCTDAFFVYGPILANTYIEMGKYLVSKEEFNQAEELFLDAISIQQKFVTGTDSPSKFDLLKSQQLLCNFYNDYKKDYDKSEKYGLKLLKYIDEFDITTHPAYKYSQIATSEWLGTIYLNKNADSVAEIFFNKAIEESKAFPNDNSVGFNSLSASCYHGLGTVFYNKNDYTRAEFYYKANIKILNSLIDRSFPYSQELLATSFIELGKIYAKTNDNPSAIIITGQALDIYEKLKKDDLVKFGYLSAANYGNISFYQLFAKQYNLAEISARKGLEVDSSQTWINTNLAHALLFQSKFEEAKRIYLEFMNQEYPTDKTKTFKYFFLQDFDEFEKAGITHPDVAKIRELLNHQ